MLYRRKKKNVFWNQTVKWNKNRRIRQTISFSGGESDSEQVQIWESFFEDNMHRNIWDIWSSRANHYQIEFFVKHHVFLTAILNSGFAWIFFKFLILDSISVRSSLTLWSTVNWNSSLSEVGSWHNPFLTAKSCSLLIIPPFLFLSKRP